MGEHQTRTSFSKESLREFVRSLLDDLQALEQMIDTGMIESEVRRIGAEQEMFIVDSGCDPSPRALEVLDRLQDPAFTTELARFNLEANLDPQSFGGSALSRLERELDAKVAAARDAATQLGSDILLAGILPTLQLSDLGLDNMTPAPRYFALNDALVSMRGGEFQIRIKGIDELLATHDNVMPEASNTSFQIHFQVDPDDFAHLYNIAQAITAPVLAAAVNSAVFLQHRLWQETRVALFQHSIDVRTETQAARGQRPRVHFGDAWIRDSVLEIFREDIARHRVALGTEIPENSLETLAAGGVPQLRALRLHNGTVYRWNRPCYGVNDGIAHLRIENRVLPSGPTIVDEVANAAFYYGLLAYYSREVEDISKLMPFEAASANFLSAARHGLNAQMRWIDGRTSSASRLILDQLLPLAAEGLGIHRIDDADITRYLGVLEERVRSGQTGAQWQLSSLEEMASSASPMERYGALAQAALENQRAGAPVHTWELARVSGTRDWRHSYRTVGQFMTKDLFTVRPDDLVDLAANLMDWEHIRHVPVEDDDGALVGLVSHRRLLRLLARGKGGADEPVAIRDIMKHDPITVTPETTTIKAIHLMREHKVACLPVVTADKLVGILTERDLINVAAKLLFEKLEEFTQK